MTNAIKIVLAILFFICLVDMPYGYYQFVRLVAMVGFSVLAYDYHEQNNRVGTIIFVVLAILFQPFIKVALGRELWNIIDVVVGLGLVVSIFIRNDRNVETG
jgi:hypothetical protein